MLTLNVYKYHHNQAKDITQWSKWRLQNLLLLHDTVLKFAKYMIASGFQIRYMYFQWA